MNNILLQSWWVLAVRGVIAVLFGLLSLLWPGITLFGFLILFAAYALTSGVVSVLGAVRHRDSDSDWWMLLLVGLVGIGAGAIAVLHPGLTVLVLLLLIGANALVTGVLDIAAAIRLRRVINNEWLMILNGAAAMTFGVLMFLFPAAGGVALVWMIGIYAVVTGALMLGLAVRLRAHMLRETPAYTGDQRIMLDRRGLIADRRGLVAHS
jgi:uncharacterized membrane protein HdeD (DUF308 family)